MKNVRKLTSIVAMVSLLLSGNAALFSNNALACGGCFSPPGVQSSQQILQDAERVFFHYDPGTHKTIVWVEVKYSGLAKDFGWVLPLPAKPKVAVGTSWVFDQFDTRHAPQFSTTVSDKDENCRNWQLYCHGSQSGSSSGGSSSSGGFGGSADAGSGAPSERDDGAVKVLEKDVAGPYDYEIIAASEAKPLLEWLNKNNYKTPDSALPILESHIKKGDVFVALKLQNGAGANEVRPIVLEMDDADPCVPLRLTAIAASDDMAVVVTLAGEGRAIPKNHMQVQPNLARVNWFANANNYQQIVSEAIDEAAGRAFVTEFSGDAKTHGPMSGRPQMVIDPVYNVTNALGLGKALLSSNIPMIQDVANTMERESGLAASAGMEPLNFYSQLRNCAANRSTNPESFCGKFNQDRGTMPVDGKKIGAALDKDFVKPVQALHDAVESSKKITRMMMKISPEEMDRDPLFAFNKDLPDVSNVHKATFTRVCEDGWYPASATRLTIPEVGSWVFKGGMPNDFSGLAVANNAVDDRFAKANAAAAIVVQDETGPGVAVGGSEVELVDTAIKGSVPGKKTLPDGMTLKEGNKRWVPPKDDDVFTRAAKRDDSECTQYHAVKAWQTGSDGAAAGVLPGGDNGNSDTKADSGCTAGGQGSSLPMALMLLLSLAVVLVRRRFSVRVQS